MLRENWRGHKIATVTLASEKAEALVAKEHLKIIWVSYRIRIKLVDPRWYEHLGFSLVIVIYTGLVKYATIAEGRTTRPLLVVRQQAASSVPVVEQSLKIPACISLFWRPPL